MTERIDQGRPQSLTAPYTDRVVGFVDILGFADLVRRADRDANLRIQIIEALSRVRTTPSPGKADTDLRTQNFSDSLILSASDTPDGLWHLLLSIDALAWNLIQIGVLIRGGVTVGGMIHDQETVFGVGVNEAYRLESTIARFPRIVLGKPAVLAARRYATEHEVWDTYRNSRLLRDQDGVWFLNYLADVGIFNRQDPNNPSMRRHPLHSVGQAIRQIIQTKIDETLDQPDIYAKVDWLARYWNAEVVSNRNDGQSPVLGPIRLAGQEPRTTLLPFRNY